LKIRGYRIEPGEVEYHLLQHPLVTGAVAAGRPSPSGGLELVAWYTAVDPVPDPDCLRAHLRRFLPNSVAPARIVAVAEFALKANGKIDMEALPDPWAMGPIASQRDVPEDGLEAGIHAIWQRVLGIENPGLDVGFFDAGGSSLLLVGLHSLLEDRHPGVVKLIELFSTTSVRDQAHLIRQRSTTDIVEAHASDWPRSCDNSRKDCGAARQVLRSDKIFRPRPPDLDGSPVVESPSALQERQPFILQRREADLREHLVSLGGSGSRTLFCLPSGSGSCIGYYHLARRLSNWKVYGLNFIETPQPAAAMADILIETQPRGDFVLLGYSIGGNMAYEIALELELRGRWVRGLVFLDTWRRLELFHFTDKEYRKNSEDFVETLDTRHLTPANRGRMVRRVEKYDRAMDSRMEDRHVPCPIRLICAEEHELKSRYRMTQEGWADLTADFKMTIGSGRHLQMLDEPHVVKNAVLVGGIIEELSIPGSQPEAVKALRGSSRRLA